MYSSIIYNVLSKGWINVSGEVGDVGECIAFSMISDDECFSVSGGLW